MWLCPHSIGGKPERVASLRTYWEEQIILSRWLIQNWILLIFLSWNNPHYCGLHNCPGQVWKYILFMLFVEALQREEYKPSVWCSHTLNAKNIYAAFLDLAHLSYIVTKDNIVFNKFLDNLIKTEMDSN